jgi:drug/metabolite transporter (DMT)-like permease
MSMPTLLARLWERPLLLLWLPPAFWAGNLVLGRALGVSFPPVSLAVGRWAVALLALLPFVLLPAWRQRRQLQASWRLILACGAFGIAGYNALGYVALQTTPAASVAFVNSMLPLLVPVAALALGVERVRPQTVLGILVSFAGVGWIVARGDPGSLDLGQGAGELIVLGAVANYALYSVLLRRKPDVIAPLVFLAATMVAGLLVLAPFWIWELAAGARIPTDAGALAAVVYIGLFASLFAFVLWNRCVAVLGATVTGVSFHLVAVFTALLAALTLGEPIRAYHLAGIALILAGFALATVRRRPVVPAPAPLPPGSR